MVPLKYLSNFWRTLEMPLINCEVNLILTWSSNCVLIATNNQNQATTFEITDTKLDVPVVTLSTEENTKFLQQLKSSFKRVINCNKYLSKPELLAQNPNLNHLIVCFYHVTFEFESESTLYSYLNVKELLARSRRHI